MALCTWLAFLVIIVACLGNYFCIAVFLRKRFRSSALTPFFVALLVADCMYFTFRVIKLAYYQETLFDQILIGTSCSISFLIVLYGYLTQYAPQLFLPLLHYEFYIRFSLILMSFLAIQRASDIHRSSYLMIQRRSSSKLSSFISILLAFLLAYLFEFSGLSLFCSSQLSSDLAYRWYKHLIRHLPNETESFIDFLHNQSASPMEIECVKYGKPRCSTRQIKTIVTHYFDMHERTIVHLIRQIQMTMSETRLGRNELRLKYHYHNCLIRLSPERFLHLYDILYSRNFNFNRYTLILVIGSILPSLTTILGNALSSYWIVDSRSSLSRHRTAETRHAILIITIECLFAILNSWLIDLILSMKYCHQSLVIGDDCPYFLRRSHQILAFFDLFNSMSNVFLYYYAGTRFRLEFQRMFCGCFLRVNPSERRSKESLHQYLQLRLTSTTRC